MLRTLLVSSALLFTTPSLAEDAPAGGRSTRTDWSLLFDAASSPAPENCCKVCRKGKACGDTCIARDKICRVGPGCACDG